MNTISRADTSKLITILAGIFVALFGIIACYTGRARGVYRRRELPYRNPKDAHKAIDKNVDATFTAVEPVPELNLWESLSPLNLDENENFQDKYTPNDYIVYRSGQAGDRQARMGRDEGEQRKRKLEEDTNYEKEIPHRGSRQAVFTDMFMLKDNEKLNSNTKLPSSGKISPTVIGIHHYFVLVWTGVVIVILFESILSVSFTLGRSKPTGKGCRFFDIAINAINFLLLFVLGIVFLYFTIAAFSKKRELVKNYDMHRIENITNSSLDPLIYYRLYAIESFVDPHDLEKSYNEFKKKRDEHTTSVQESLFNKYEGDIMSRYKDDMRYVLQVQTGVYTILYSFLFLINIGLLFLERNAQDQQTQSDDYYNNNEPYDKDYEFQQGPEGSMVNGTIGGGPDSLAPTDGISNSSKVPGPPK